MSKDDNKASKVDKGRGLNGQFLKGKEKTGGRKKGTPNKRTVDFIERLGDFDLVAELKKLYHSTKDDNLKGQILKTLMEYAYPKRKAVEMSADMNVNTDSIQIELI